MTYCSSSLDIGLIQFREDRYFEAHCLNLLIPHLFGGVIVEATNGSTLDDITDWNVEGVCDAVEGVVVFANVDEGELELVILGFGRRTDQVDPFVTHSLIL